MISTSSAVTVLDARIAGRGGGIPGAGFLSPASRERSPWRPRPRRRYRSDLRSRSFAWSPLRAALRELARQ